MAENNAANLPLIVSRERTANTIRDALRLYIGRGRRYSVKRVSNATGVKDRVIECAMTDFDNIDWRPLPSEALLSISFFLGADFTSEWLRLAQQGAFEYPDDSEPNPGDMAVSSSEDTTEIMRRGADGEFCRDDRQALKIVGQRSIHRGMALVAAAGKAAA